MSKCKYCDGEYGEGPSKAIHRSILNLGEFGKVPMEMYLFDDCKLIYGPGDIAKTVMIKYCPMCGRKLDPKALMEAAGEA